MNPRDEARLRGDETYFDPMPCVNGHRWSRRVSDGRCLMCVEVASPVEEMLPPVVEDEVVSQPNKRRRGNPRARDTARLAGERTFTTGLACHRGHIGPRYTINGNCVECLRVASPMPKQLDEAAVMRYAVMFDEGLSVIEIAEREGVSRALVYRYLARTRMPRRKYQKKSGHEDG